MAGMEDMGMGSDMGAMGGDEASESDGFEPKDDEEREIKDFMDESLPMPDRVSALQEAIRLCVEKHVSPDSLKDYGSSEGGEKPGGGLAMIFGAPKKKS